MCESPPLLLPNQQELQSAFEGVRDSDRLQLGQVPFLLDEFHTLRAFRERCLDLFRRMENAKQHPPAPGEGDAPS